MSRPRIIPALADLTQDIAGPVQLRILQQWGTGERSRAAATDLLEPFRIEAVVASTDTSGLSKMTESMDLVRVLLLISRPKEVIHALGVEIGGRAIGHWVADNTEMLYPSSVPADDVVRAMWEAQQRISEYKFVPIGICVHYGGYYEIGGGLYGPDANTVERLAEDHAQGGELLVTRALRERLSSAYEFLPRQDLTAFDSVGVSTVTRAERRPDLQETRRDYPHLYTDEFFRDLNALEHAPDASAHITSLYARYLRAEAVVFLAKPRSEPGPDLESILDDLLTNALIDVVVLREASRQNLVRCGGGLAILTFTDAREALEFAFHIHSKFESNELPIKIGVDYGAILYFDRPDGIRNLMGDPVNVVSKISEDFGQPGRICITSRVTEFLPEIPQNAEPFKLTVSNVTIHGYRISP